MTTAILTTIWGYLVRGGSALWASVAALWASPAVWLACGAIFVGGFSAGHWERNHVVKKLRNEITETTAEKDGAQARMSDAVQKLQGALAEAKAIKAAYDKYKAEHPPAATPAPAKGKKKGSAA